MSPTHVPHTRGNLSLYVISVAEVSLTHVIMPDAQEEQALNGIIGAAFGAAGQR